jgi:hypothetical protein
MSNQKVNGYFQVKPMLSLTTVLLLQTVSIVTSFVSMTEPVFACGGAFPPPPPPEPMMPPPPPPPPPTWIKFNPNIPGTALFGVQLGNPSNPQTGLFAPTVPTSCGTGIAIYNKQDPQQSVTLLVPSLNVSSVTFNKTNLLTNESVELLDAMNNPIFALGRDNTLDNQLAVGVLTPNPQNNGFPLSRNQDNWFGFSGIVNPFVAPTLGANEVFTAIFSIGFNPMERSALEGLGIQFAGGTTNDLREHPVSYSGEAMAMQNEKVPEPSSILSLLALGLFGGILGIVRRKM